MARRFLQASWYGVLPSRWNCGGIRLHQENAFLSDDWLPLYLSLGYVINITEFDDYFTIQTYAERFDGHPRTSPYFTICVQSDGQVEAEIAGNAQVSPKLTVEEYDLMELLGWEKPTAGKDETFGDFPNFRKVYPLKADGHLVADDILTALVLVYQLKTTDMIGVGSLSLANNLESLKQLDRLETEPWNKDRKLFRIPMKEDL